MALNFGLRTKSQHLKTSLFHSIIVVERSYFLVLAFFDSFDADHLTGFLVELFSQSRVLRFICHFCLHAISK